MVHGPERKMELGGRRNLKMVVAVAAVCLAVLWNDNPAAAQSEAGEAAGAKPSLSAPAKPATGKGTPAATAAQIKTTSNLVTMPVTVTDAAGNFVYDLSERDFQILDNGVPQQITRFDTESPTVAAVILVQTNEEAGPLLSRLTNIGPIISQLLLGPNGEAAVLFFDDRVQETQDFSSSSDKLDKTLTSLGNLHLLGDKARLNDALMRAVAMLEQRPQDERRVILAISTGADSGSETSRAEVVRRATAGEVTIYGLRLSPLQSMLKKKPEAPPNNPMDIDVARPMPPGMPATPDMSARVYETPIPLGKLANEGVSRAKNVVSKTDLAFLASFTGGAYYSQWSSEKLQDDLDHIASEVHSQYELAYVPNDLTQTGFHRIEVRLREMPRLKVRAREGYFFYKGQVGKAP
jgi:VWFA-related protein